MGDAAGRQPDQFEPFLDINNARLERRPARPPTDNTHVLQGERRILQLPFGPKHRLYNPEKGSRRSDRRLESGRDPTPSSRVRRSGSYSARGTLNRAGRRAKNDEYASSTKPQLDESVHLRA